MFDIGATELLVVVIAAIIFIGPKDLPLALRTAGRWIGKMRRVSNHLRAGLDTMIREAEMEEQEKEWRARNAQIMQTHPADAQPARLSEQGGGDIAGSPAASSAEARIALPGDGAAEPTASAETIPGGAAGSESATAKL